MVKVDCVLAKYLVSPVCHYCLLQGDACSICPSLPAEVIKPDTIYAVPGTPGEKGEKGEPGTGLPGKNVSSIY